VNFARFPRVDSHMPPATKSTLGEVLSVRTVEGELYEKLENKSLRCFACGHRCKILDGLQGICKVRYNEDGVLKVPRGYAAALQVDPIEKKPFSRRRRCAIRWQSRRRATSSLPISSVSRSSMARRSSRRPTTNR
jgi:hypothetical protein